MSLVSQMALREKTDMDACLRRHDGLEEGDISPVISTKAGIHRRTDPEPAVKD
jgi:hypothetical protein